MIAPSGGFWPDGSSGGIGVSVYLLQRKRYADRRLEQRRRRDAAVDARDLPQRRDVVEDPERAAVRADRDVVVLDDEISNRRRRHVEPERRPVVAVVERDPDLRLGPGEQQPFPLRIFAHDVDRRAVGQCRS